MKRPLFDYHLRQAMRDYPDYKGTKKMLKDLEYWRAMREADREIERWILPIIKWLDNLIKRFTK